MMSARTSGTTGRRYGLERVCRMWGRSRSALYARRARARRLERGARPARVRWRQGDGGRDGILFLRHRRRPAAAASAASPTSVWASRAMSRPILPHVPAAMPRAVASCANRSRCAATR